MVFDKMVGKEWHNKTPILDLSMNLVTKENFSTFSHNFR